MWWKKVAAPKYKWDMDNSRCHDYNDRDGNNSKALAFLSLLKLIGIFQYSSFTLWQIDNRDRKGKKFRTFKLI